MSNPLTVSLPFAQLLNTER